MTEAGPKKVYSHCLLLMCVVSHTAKSPLNPACSQWADALNRLSQTQCRPCQRLPYIWLTLTSPHHLTVLYTGLMLHAKTKVLAHKEPVNTQCPHRRSACLLCLCPNSSAFCHLSELSGFSSQGCHDKSPTILSGHTQDSQVYILNANTPTDFKTLSREHRWRKRKSHRH